MKSMKQWPLTRTLQSQSFCYVEAKYYAVEKNNNTICSLNQFSYKEGLNTKLSVCIIHIIT